MTSCYIRNPKWNRNIKIGSISLILEINWRSIERNQTKLLQFKHWLNLIVFNWKVPNTFQSKSMYIYSKWLCCKFIWKLSGPSIRHSVSNKHCSMFDDEWQNTIGNNAKLRFHLQCKHVPILKGIAEKLISIGLARI